MSKQSIKWQNNQSIKCLNNQSIKCQNNQSIKTIGGFWFSLFNINFLRDTGKSGTGTGAHCTGSGSSLLA
jgi:hypothetical protein